MSRLTIRWKLTLSSIGAVALVLVGAFFLTHWQVSRILEDANAQLARADLASFIADIEHSRGEHTDVPGTGVLVYIRSPSGAVQQDTMPEELRQRVSSLASTAGEVTARSGGVEYELVRETVSTSSGDWVLWAARSNASVPVALARLDSALLVGLLALLVLLGIASFVIATAALRPVARLRAAAERLAVGDGSTMTAPALPVGAARDEIGALATTLNRFLDEIRSTSDRERHMVSDASHELRTPLAVLQTQLELAHGHAGDAAALERELMIAESSVARLAALASNLLELSRLEASHGSSGSSTTDQLTDEVLASVDRARLVATNRRIDIEFRLERQTISTSVAIDVVSFARVVDNLLANAVSAVDSSAGEIEVMLASSARETVLEVRDNGRGMPEEFVARAFDRFSRPDFARSSAEGGAGLGLSLVQSIAHSAGGIASIQRLDVGTILRVVLPNI